METASGAEAGPSDIDLARDTADLNQYRNRLTESLLTFKRDLGLIIPRSLNDLDRYAPSEGWTPWDKAAFFHALERHSRWRPDSIAADLQKDEFEVVRYLTWLSARDGEYKRRKKGKRSSAERDWGWQAGMAPAAREIPAETILREEVLARRLLDEEEAQLGRVCPKVEQIAAEQPPVGALTAQSRYLHQSQCLTGDRLPASTLRNLAILLRVSAATTLSSKRLSPSDPPAGNVSAKVARDDSRIAHLASVPLAERSKEEMAELRVLNNRRRMRIRKRVEKLVKDGMTLEDIEAAGGADVIYANKRSRATPKTGAKAIVVGAGDDSAQLPGPAEEDDIEDRLRGIADDTHGGAIVKQEESSPRLSKYGKILRDEARLDYLKHRPKKMRTREERAELCVIQNRRRMRIRARSAKLKSEGWTDEQVAEVNVDEVFAKRAGLVWGAQPEEGSHDLETDRHQARQEGRGEDLTGAPPDLAQPSEGREAANHKIPASELERLGEEIMLSGLDLFNFDHVATRMAQADHPALSTTMLDQLRTYLLAYLAPLLHDAILIAENDPRCAGEVEAWHVTEALESHPPTRGMGYDPHPGQGEPITALETAAWLDTLSASGVRLAWRRTREGEGGSGKAEDYAEDNIDTEWEVKTCETDEEDEALEDLLDRADEAFDRVTILREVEKGERLKSKWDNDDPFESWRFRAAKRRKVVPLESGRSAQSEAEALRDEYLALLRQTKATRRARRRGRRLSSPGLEASDSTIRELLDEGDGSFDSDDADDAGGPATEEGSEDLDEDDGHDDEIDPGDLDEHDDEEEGSSGDDSPSDSDSEREEEGEEVFDMDASEED